MGDCVSGTVLWDCHAAAHLCVLNQPLYNIFSHIHQDALADLSSKYSKLANTTSKVAGVAKGLQSKLPTGSVGSPGTPDARENKGSTQF